MARPKIVIVDSDSSYIIPLQLKFVEDFFEKVDLDIITDHAFFEEYFSSPQRADILIISEDFYAQSLQRHNITNIFIMTEQYEEDQTADLNTTLIFKYTSIKEIFNEIIGKASNVLNGIAEEKKETRIVLVYSASGGVGKTTISMGISGCLTKNYKRVLYLNAGHLQSFQRLLDNQIPISSSDIYAKLNNPTETIYADLKHVVRKELFSYLPPFKAALMSLGLSYSLYKAVALSAKKSEDFDYVIIDADSTFDEDKAELFDIADKVVVVTEQTAASVYATNVLASNITGMSEEKYVFVCNNFNKDEDNALISPSMNMRFSVSDYIEHIYHYDQLKCSDLVKNNDIQKTAYLVI